MKILDRLPIPEKRASIKFDGKYATVHRNQALVWVGVHIFYLIGFRNRILVMVQWAWTYTTSAHGARLIMGNQRLPGWNALVPARKPVRVGPLDLASPADHDLPEDQNIVEVSSTDTKTSHSATA